MDESVPVTREQPKLWERILWRIGLASVKLLMRLLRYHQTRYTKLPLDQKPTYTKYYPVRPTLINYVWIPKSYKPGSSPPLPLLIDIHGGGFCHGHPFMDDKDNAILCHKYGICIVSINYRKAPGYPFPIPVEDVAALIQAVLDDPELPVDKSKVAIVGYSAGGNLALTGPQLNGLHDKIKGVVAFYPVADFKRTLNMRISLATPPPSRGDILVRMWRALDWAYVGRREDLENPLLSPLYAGRDVLPRKLFVMGCEYDILCAEAREAAEKWATQEPGTPERNALGEGRTGWKCGDVTWEELKGLEHGYNQRTSTERDEVIKELWTKRSGEVLEKVAEWLFKEVYA